MEVTQFTYFQQMGGFDCKPVAGELTYGLERLAMYIQNVDNVYDLRFSDAVGNVAAVTYGDVFLENEKQFSKWNFEVADTDTLVRGLQGRRGRVPARDRGGRAAWRPMSRRSRRATSFNLLAGARRDQRAGARELHGARPRPREGQLQGVDRQPVRALDCKISGVDAVTDFLLELRSEEIPARMQAGARAELAQLFRAQLTRCGRSNRGDAYHLVDAAPARADRREACRKRPRR